MSGASGDQFRISQVQLLNWGAFCNLVSIPMDRDGTAVLGPSGVGKSTMLDGMASVIFPNPQEFNQAARDDMGSKRERTPYSYARGQTEQVIDGSGQSTQTRYLRPPGSAPFASGVSIEWQRDDGSAVTVFRIAWVAADANGAESITKTTVYGFVNDSFDLARLDGLSGYRANSSPLAPASVRALVDTARGDIVEDTQSRVHAKMRDAMGMGETEESQRLALQLLRRAQASKGIANINSLFTDFVLTEPQALARWMTTLEAMLEAFRLYDEYADVARQLKTLERLPGQAESFSNATRDIEGKRALVEVASGELHPRLRIWHARAVYEWSDREIDDLRLEKAEVADDLQRHRLGLAQAESDFEAAIAAITSAGGDRAEALTVRLAGVEADRDRILTHRDDLAARLKTFELSVPESDGELELLRVQLEQTGERIDRQLESARSDSDRKVFAAGEASRRAREASGHLDELDNSRSNVDPRYAALRERIGEGAGVPVDRLRFFGELIQVRDEYRGWEKAVRSVLSGVARDLVVSSDDLPSVRSWINGHDVGQHVVTIAEATQGRKARQPVNGTVPDVLEIADSPHREWVLDELVARFSYRLVETDSDLDEALPQGVRGAVTRAGMRTAPNGRYVKDDRSPTFTGIGWDTSRLRFALQQQRDASHLEKIALDEASAAAQAHYDELRDRRSLLGAVERDLRWESIDTASLDQRIAELKRDISGSNSPEINALRTQLDDAKTRQSEANARMATTNERLIRLDARDANLCTLQDNQSEVLERHEPLSDDETAFVSGLSFTPPPSDSANDERALDRAVGQSYQNAEHKLLGDIETMVKVRASAEGGVLTVMRAYRALGDVQARQIDEDIASLDTLLAVHEQLVTDDLPRTRARWLEKANSDMSSQLVLLMRTIEEDRRAISAGLEPINGVLASVPFRAASTLQIEAIGAPTRALDIFGNVVTQYTQGAIGRDDPATEDAFITLRKRVEGMTGQKDTAAETWRRQVFDARTHMTFRATESRPDGETAVWDGVSGMSGGEGQELIAFILGAALRYRLGEGTDRMPTYASIVLDEGFVKSDSDYTGRAMAAIRALGFQVIIGAPREKASALQDYVSAVAYIAKLKEGEAPVGAWRITMDEALELEDVA